MHLATAAAAAGVRLVFREAVTSTNAEALALARGGLRGPLWLVARTQTAGRGRRGRAWVSPAGNLYATLLLTDLNAAAGAAQLSFVAALAVRDAVCQLAPSLAPQLSLKWPNDLLCEGRKFCGILLEGESSAGGATTVVVGIGVNCAHHPSDAAAPAPDLPQTGASVTCENLFPVLSLTFNDRIAQWRGGAGFDTIRSDWLAHADGLGRQVAVRLHDRETTGVFEALDAHGQLALRHADGTIEHIAAGDVFPLQLIPAEHL